MPKTTKKPATMKKSSPVTKKEAPSSVGLKPRKASGKTPKAEPASEPLSAVD